jgi:hypothetical protein
LSGSYLTNIWKSAVKMEAAGLLRMMVDYTVL